MRRPYRLVFAASLVVLFAFILVIPSGQTSAVAQTPSAVGTLKVTKSVPSVTSNNEVTVLLTIKNNGSVPVFGIEIYEYFNPSFKLLGTGKVTQPSGTVTVPLTPSNTVTQVQAIVDPPEPDSLQPGESLTLSYKEFAAGAGDFQVPQSLVWFDYYVGNTQIKASYYSNSVIIHIPSATEKIAIEYYPFVLAAATFTVTMIILLWARKQLSVVDRKRFSKV